MPSLAHLPVSALGTAAVRIVDIAKATNSDELTHSTLFLNMETKEGRYACGFTKLVGCLYIKEVIVLLRRLCCGDIANPVRVTIRRSITPDRGNEVYRP